MKPVAAAKRIGALRWLVLGLAFLLASACDLPSSQEPTVTPVPTQAPQPSATPAPPTATPTPTPTPPPTPDPEAISATIAAGEALAHAAGTAPICLRSDDLDGDGVGEWAGLYLVQGDPARLLGFVIDGEVWHDLEPAEGGEVGLGEYSVCEMEVGDVNSDGRVELAVWGHSGTSAGLLHIFAWNGSRYALLGAFEGDGGVRLEDANNDLIRDVLVRLRPEGGLVREIVYTWDGSHYAWTWDRYAWYYLDRPHAYVTDTPLHALASFYLALDDRDLPGAYSLLSASAQSLAAYDSWALGFSTTLAVEVGASRVVSQAGDGATVAAQVQALDNVRGSVILTLYEVEWQMVRTESGWRLENGISSVLEQRELSYFR
jgi:hypothetical protein